MTRLNKREIPGSLTIKNRVVLLAAKISTKPGESYAGDYQPRRSGKQMIAPP